MEDPREIHSDDALSKLTDDEKIVSDDSGDESVDEQLRELEKQRLKLIQRKERRAEEHKAKKRELAEVNKSPSPNKKRPTVSMNSSHLESPTQKFEYQTSSNRNPVGNESTSYFVKMLEETHSTDQNEKEEAKRLLNSRIYTFNQDLVCEPFTVNEKEYFSGQNISKRYLKHDSLAEFLSDKKVLRLPKLYAKTAPPNFEEPRYANWVVIGIISKKTTARPTSDGRSKYITMTLTDYKLNIDVLIFGKSVEKYVKLRLGDVIAILNPDIFPWKPDAQGIIRSFSLSIKQSFDCVLEIGKAKDFGLCQSLKKDGTICGTPINKSTEDCCFYHKELRLRKTQGKRMELNGSFNLRSPTKNGKKQQFLMSRKDNEGNYSNSTIFEDRYAPKVDRVSKSLVYFSNPHAGRAFFDDTYQNPELLKNIDEKKRKIKERKKESELRAKLLRLGEKPAVKKVPLSKNDQDAIHKKKALLKTSFQEESLRNIGYDPTSKPNSKGVLESDETILKNETLLNELSSITQNRTINLGLSKEEAAKRKQQRSEADNMIKKIKAKESLSQKEVLYDSARKKKQKEAEDLKDVELDSGSDSDSDFEFEVERNKTEDAYRKFKLSQSQNEKVNES